MARIYCLHQLDQVLRSQGDGQLPFYLGNLVVGCVTKRIPATSRRGSDTFQYSLQFEDDELLPIEQITSEYIKQWHDKICDCGQRKATLGYQNVDGAICDVRWLPNNPPRSLYQVSSPPDQDKPTPPPPPSAVEQTPTEQPNPQFEIDPPIVALTASPDETQDAPAATSITDAAPTCSLTSDAIRQLTEPTPPEQTTPTTIADDSDCQRNKLCVATDRSSETLPLAQQWACWQQTQSSCAPDSAKRCNDTQGTETPKFLSIDSSVEDWLNPSVNVKYSTLHKDELFFPLSTQMDDDLMSLPFDDSAWFENLLQEPVVNDDSLPLVTPHSVASVYNQSGCVLRDLACHDVDAYKRLQVVMHDGESWVARGTFAQAAAVAEQVVRAKRAEPLVPVAPSLFCTHGNLCCAESKEDAAQIGMMCSHGHVYCKSCMWLWALTMHRAHANYVTEYTGITRLPFGSDAFLCPSQQFNCCGRIDRLFTLQQLQTNKADLSRMEVLHSKLNLMA
jgi:hypothetical protein